MNKLALIDFIKHFKQVIFLLYKFKKLFLDFLREE